MPTYKGADKLRTMFTKSLALVVVSILFAVCLIVSLRMVSVRFSPQYMFQSPSKMRNDPESLRFNGNGSFTIVQFADLHYGDFPSADAMSTKVMFNVLDAETDVNFAVFTGDQVSGHAQENVRKTFALWTQALLPVVNHRIPFATIFGNHDDQPYGFGPVVWVRWVNGILGVIVAIWLAVLSMHSIRRWIWFPSVCLAAALWILFQVSPSTNMRRSLLSYEKTLFYPLSKTELGPRGLGGVSNYYLPVFHGENDMVLLFFLDSGGGRLPEKLSVAQIEWVGGVSASFGNCHSMAFIHIPSYEYGSTENFGCFGDEKLEEGSEVFDGDVGAPMAALASVGVEAVFAGHNHRNSWCCVPTTRLPSAMPALCYGRHSGYGGYGDWIRGARVIRLSFQDSKLAIDTWLRMEDKTVRARGKLFPFSQ
jgi:hypothetical protein